MPLSQGKRIPNGPTLKQTLELITDVLTLYHLGIYRYETFASDHVIIEETWTIRKRTDEIKKQGVPGVQAVRKAKVEWLARITQEAR